MFYTTVDNSIARYEFDNGIEVAFAYDSDAECPPSFDDPTTVPVGVRRKGADAIAHDPHGLFDSYDSEDYRLNRDFLDFMVTRFSMAYGDDFLLNPEAWADDEWEELVDLTDWDVQLAPPAHVKVFTYVARDEYGWPVFEVAVDLKRLADLRGISYDSLSPDVIESEVDSYGREYAAWAEGSVYQMGIETSDGDTDYIGDLVGWDIHDVDTVREMCHAFFGVRPGSLVS